MNPKLPSAVRHPWTCLLGLLALVGHGSPACTLDASANESTTGDAPSGAGGDGTGNAGGGPPGSGGQGEGGRGDGGNASSSGTGGSGSGGSPNINASCLTLFESDSTIASGVYDLDPDGPGGEDPFQAFCDMEHEGGGWTLVLKIDGEENTFDHDEDLWTNADTYRPNEADFDDREAKLASFATVGFKEVALGMRALDSKTVRWIQIEKPASSLLAVMAGGYQPTTVGAGTWESLLDSGSLQVECRTEGFNVELDDRRVRIGIIADDQQSCADPNSFIGFGSDDFGASGNFAQWFPDHGDRDTVTFGYVMVR
jgi:hypothetical protein